MTESYAKLSDVLGLPAGLFGLELVDYPGHEGAEEGKGYLTANSATARLARLDEPSLALLHRKLQAYWTRVFAPFDDSP